MSDAILDKYVNDLEDIICEIFYKGYDKAIDDFAEICLKHKSKDDYPIICFDEETIKKFAEHLKDGGKNEEKMG